MKRFLSALLLVVLCVCLSLSSALAETAAYSSTQSFIDLLDSNDVVYTLAGVDSDNDECVRIKNSGDAFNYTIVYYFDEDLEHTAMYVWNIISFDAADKDAVMRVCNKLNYDYKYLRFYVDETDNTVSADMHLMYRGDTAADINWEATMHTVSLLDIGYEELGQYDND